MDFSSSHLDSDGKVQSLYAHSPNDDALTDLDDPKIDGEDGEDEEPNEAMMLSSDEELDDKGKKVVQYKMLDGDEGNYFYLNNCVGGYSYLYEPLWWVGMITMIVREIANFAAYAFAPAILVTPLGALSIIISSALARVILREKLHIFGVLGCALCVVGSTTIVLHAPQEREIESVTEVWDLATEPAFLLYASLAIAAIFIIIIYFMPQYGQTHIRASPTRVVNLATQKVMSVKHLELR